MLDMHVAAAKPSLQPALHKERRSQPTSSPKGSQKTGASQVLALSACQVDTHLSPPPPPPPEGQSSSHPALTL